MAYGSSMVRNHLNPARDYVFNWGVYKDVRFTDIPNNYVSIIVSNPYLLDKYLAAKDLLHYHRLGLQRTAPNDAQLAAHEGTQSTTTQPNRTIRSAPPKS